MIIRIEACILLLVNVVDALVVRGADPNSTSNSGHKRDSNVSEDHLAQATRLANCTPPASFLKHLKQNGTVLLSTSATHSIHAVQDDLELNIFAYDCVKQKELIFVHIPKNAGTTIEHLAAEKDIRWGYYDLDGLSYMPDGNKCTDWHIPPSMFAPGNNPYEGAEVFCVTRDPWDRVLSDYMYYLSHSDWNPPFVRDGPTCTVNGLNVFIDHALSSMNHGNRWILNCHMLPQWDFIQGPDGRQWCTHRLNIKDLTAEFNHLMFMHDLPLRLKPHDKKNSAADFCPGLSAQADHDKGSVFWAYNKAAMRSMYKKDFDNLGDSLL